MIREEAFIRKGSSLERALVRERRSLKRDIDWRKAVVREEAFIRKGREKSNG